MSVSSHERVSREDMVTFVNACFSCTGQSEFYGDSAGQAVSIQFLHEYILGNYRRLYARTLAAGINDFNKAQIVGNLLATGRSTPRSFAKEEGELVFAALDSLPAPRALRVLEALREHGVNNRRARAVARRYLASRRDPVFTAVKYRNKVRVVASHAHARLPGEMSEFLFAGWKKKKFETPLFELVRAAHFSAEAVYALPYTVAEGFARKHRIPRDEFLTRIEPNLTALERLRLQSNARSHGAGNVVMDLRGVPLTRLAIYVASLSREEREGRRAEIDAAFDEAARRAFKRARSNVGLGRVAAILDRSYSSFGSAEKRKRPLAIALGVSKLLAAAAKEYRAIWTPALPDDDELLFTAHGQTDLAEPLLRALEWGAETIVIVSDGFENDPPHGAAEVARVFRARLDPRRLVSIVHVNPVFDAETYAPKAIGPAIPTVGLRDAEDLLTVLGFARFAEGAAPLSQLEDYLAGRVQELLHAGHAKTSAAPSEVSS